MGTLYALRTAEISPKHFLFPLLFFSPCTAVTFWTLIFLIGWAAQRSTTLRFLKTSRVKMGCTTRMTLPCSSIGTSSTTWAAVSKRSSQSASLIRTRLVAWRRRSFCGYRWCSSSALLPFALPWLCSLDGSCPGNLGLLVAKLTNNGCRGPRRSRIGLTISTDPRLVGTDRMSKRVVG